MRILFAGSPALAVPSLEALHKSHQIVAVLTNPDRPRGRGKHPEATPVKEKALSLGVPVLQPARLDAAFHEQVRTLAPELLVVVAFGRIFKEEFLSLFPRGGINLHASLLPRHRGPSPISAAILGGDRETGVTVQMLAPEMDAGDILAVRRIPLTGRETTGSLSAALAELGAEVLPAALEDWQRERIQPQPQNHARATYCRMVRKEQGRVDWSSGAAAIERMIRAYDPWPRAFTLWNGQRLNLIQGGIYPQEAESAEKPRGLVLAVDNRYGILVNTGGGVLYLSSLQLQAKKVLDWRSFLNGQKDFIGAQLGD